MTHRLILKMEMKQAEIIRHFSQNIEDYQGKVIGLIGDLGAGKTHLIREVLAQIDTDLGTQVNSPTYNLCNVYTGQNIEVHHFDLYRIESEEELYHINLWESMEMPSNLTFIEWVNLFDEIEGQCDEIIRISIEASEERTYTIQKNR